MRITMPRRPGLAGITTLLAVSLIALPALFHDTAPAPLLVECAQVGHTLLSNQVLVMRPTHQRACGSAA
jgi:ABC-type cobalamin transport system permease subunit